MTVLHRLLQDLRFAARLLARSPAFTSLALLVLALGIGATTAIFSFADAMLLKPLAFPDADRLVVVWDLRPGAGGKNIPSPLTYQAWRAHNQVFSHVAAFSFRGNNLNLSGPAGDSDRAERLRGGIVSANYFDTLGARPMLGRVFRPDEDEFGKHRVAVLSNRLWRYRFAADPNAVGREITLNDEKYTVIGVLPPGGVFDRSSQDIWIPMTLAPQDLDYGTQFFMVLARLRPGVTLEQARAEMKRLAEGLNRDAPRWRQNYSVFVEPLREQVIRPHLQRAARLLLGAVGLLLLIGCANIANLLLARSAAREREVAIRASLGAGPWRLLQQFLAESVLLAGLGGVLGVLLSLWLTRGLLALAPSNLIPVESAVTVDWRVLAFALLVSLATGILFGLAPAWQASRRSIAGRLPGPSRGFSARGALLTGEVALTFLLVAGSALLMTSFLRLLGVDTGFVKQNVLTLRTILPESRYPDAVQLTSYQTRLLQAIRSLPAVVAAASTNAMPLGGSSINTGAMFVDGRRDRRADGGVRLISSDYCRAMGLRLLEGRPISERDTASAPAVAIVNQTFASRFFAGAPALSRRVQFGDKPGYAPAVIGVVADVKDSGLNRDSKPEIYLPFLQMPAKDLPFFGRTVHVVVRTASRPEHLAGVIQSVAASVDKDQPLFQFKTMEDVVADSVAEPRFHMLLFGLFGVLALALAAAGIYGVLFYSVSQRTREIGVRMALGAQVSHVVRMVLRQGLVLTLIGIAAGLAAALVLTRLLQSFLFEVKPTDPTVLLAVAAVVIATALAACYPPARRAARIDAMAALRHE